MSAGAAPVNPLEYYRARYREEGVDDGRVVVVYDRTTGREIGTSEVVAKFSIDEDGDPVVVILPTSLTRWRRLWRALGRTLRPSRRQT